MISLVDVTHTRMLLLFELSYWYFCIVGMLVLLLFVWCCADSGVIMIVNVSFALPIPRATIVGRCYGRPGYLC